MYTKQNTKQSKERLVEYLQKAGIRATRQRLDLAALLFDGTHKHVTAEHVHERLQKKRVAISLATVYNSLHQFTEAGLLNEVSIDPVRTYFDTNREPHYHFFDETCGQLMDIPANKISLGSLPAAPKGRVINRVEVILLLGKKK